MVPGYDKIDDATGTDWFPLNRRLRSVVWSVAGGAHVTQTFRDDRAMQTVPASLAAGHTLYLTVTASRPGAPGYDNTAISEIRISCRTAR
ncbi:hypothetical protein GCM10011594_08050 [Nakamurella endophytica]|uniref:Uncharacterized protein n=1 Tax=Nakamurella endophytica TaxID=1748367 RepID=A0A917WCV2_9ACTN|nr:hypothetical protein GCM10011594_08050 [Nakamurella endophytica]